MGRKEHGYYPESRGRKGRSRQPSKREQALSCPVLTLVEIPPPWGFQKVVHKLTSTGHSNLHSSWCLLPSMGWSRNPATWLRGTTTPNTFLTKMRLNCTLRSYSSSRLNCPKSSKKLLEHTSTYADLSFLTSLHLITWTIYGDICCFSLLYHYSLPGVCNLSPTRLKSGNPTKLWITPSHYL